MDMGLIGYFVCFLHLKSELGLRRVIKNPPSYSHRVIIAIVGLVTKKNLEWGGGGVVHSLPCGAACKNC